MAVLTGDNEVGEYALSRTLSPALIAEYQTRLPDKDLLQAKLHEFYELAQHSTETSAKSHNQRRSKVPSGKAKGRNRK